jgi:hypothetical protein
MATSPLVGPLARILVVANLIIFISENGEIFFLKIYKFSILFFFHFVVFCFLFFGSLVAYWRGAVLRLVPPGNTVVCGK